METRSFASDNYSEVDKVVLKEINNANYGDEKSYGKDKLTIELNEIVKSKFGERALILPVTTGTSANIISLLALSKRHESVIVAKSSHLHVDECGAPESTGIKLLTMETEDGKLNKEIIAKECYGYGDQHRAQPKIVSITQSTELGTCYKENEIKSIVTFCKKNGLKIHVDGARLMNAASTLNVGLEDISSNLKIDALSLGFTKNGALNAEAIILFDEKIYNDAVYLRKQKSQLMSKQRFLSAQILAMLRDDHWAKNASNANSMALYLASEIDKIDELKVRYKVEANAVFAVTSNKLANHLSSKFGFYIWDESVGLIRLMTSFNTTKKDIDIFIKEIKKEILISKLGN